MINLSLRHCWRKVLIPAIQFQIFPLLCTLQRCVEIWRSFRFWSKTAPISMPKTLPSKYCYQNCRKIECLNLKIHFASLCSLFWARTGMCTGLYDKCGSLQKHCAILFRSWRNLYVLCFQINIWNWKLQGWLRGRSKFLWGSSRRSSSYRSGEKQFRDTKSSAQRQCWSYGSLFFRNSWIRSYLATLADDEGNTALHFAAKNGNSTSIELLLQKCSEPQKVFQNQIKKLMKVNIYS